MTSWGISGQQIYPRGRKRVRNCTEARGTRGIMHPERAKFLLATGAEVCVKKKVQQLQR